MKEWDSSASPGTRNLCSAEGDVTNPGEGDGNVHEADEEGKRQNSALSITKTVSTVTISLFSASHSFFLLFIYFLGM